MSLLSYIFGDSVMKGVVLDEHEARYRLLPETDWKALGGDIALDVKNRSHFGCTVDKGLRVVKKALARGPKPSFALLEYGGNDCDFHWEAVAANPRGQHEPRTPLPRFLEIYEELIDYLRAAEVEPVLMNLPPIDGSYYLRHIVEQRGLDEEALLEFLAGDSNQICRYQELYSRQIEALARRKDLPLFDCRSAFLAAADFRALICADGLHPNARGHQLIYESLRQFIRDWASQRLEGRSRQRGLLAGTLL